MKSNQRQVFMHTKVEGIGQRTTVAGIIDYSSNQISIGVSTCGKKDVFTRKMGRTIASGRAAKKPAVIKTFMEGQNPIAIFQELAIPYIK